MTRQRRDGRLWAVSCYYNPAGYRRRRTNYDVFRRHLRIPLLTVELAYGPLPELGPGDADILVQLRGRDVMWQKERLLNLAASRLPPECDRVAWLDCDVVYADDGWAEQLERALQEFALVQAFDRVRYLTRDWQPGMPGETATDFVAPSVVGAVRDGVVPAEVLGKSLIDRRKLSMAGFAWGARREVFERVGLYDAAIIGGGDRLMASACYGCAETMAVHHLMQGARLDHFLAWASRWSEAVGGSIGVLEAEILNQWHGNLADRQGVERQRRLAGYGFDPYRDIALDEQGAWRWNSDKPALHAYLRDYFVGRREDG